MIENIKIDNALSNLESIVFGLQNDREYYYDTQIQGVLEDLATNIHIIEKELDSQ